MQNEKKKGSKNTLLGSLAGMLKNYSHISNKRPPNCLIAKFSAKIRILKFRPKKYLILVFGAATLKNHCHIWIQHPRICLVAKFREKNKNS